MKNIMFQTLVYQFFVSNWDESKEKIKLLLDDNNFIHNGCFATDRSMNNNSYLNEFISIIKPELEMFAKEAEIENIHITNVWAVRYSKGDFHPPHTHSSSGYSGVLYLDYDENVHTGTYFVDPITDIVTDLTNYSYPTVYEGSITIAPSNVLHFTHPNKSDQIRSIIGFDIKF